MKFIYALLLSCILSTAVFAETITDFNPLWDFGTGSGADATGAGTLEGVTFTMDFSLNGGSKLFASTTNQYTSNSTLGHGGVPGTLILGGGDAAGINGEGLTITFISPVTVTLGLSHIANVTGTAQYDGWQFVTPADAVISLANNHELIGTTSIDGMKSKEDLTVSDATTISYFQWNNVTTIDLTTLGSTGTTIGLSSMAISPAPSAVPSLSLFGLLLLGGLLGLLGMRKTLQK